MKLVDTAFRIGNTVLKLAKHHAPTIMLVGGSISVITGGILACKQTLKAGEILDAHNAQLDIVDNATNNHANEYTKNDRTKDLISVYCGTAGQFIRLYGPSLLLEAAGFAAIFAGFGIIKKRYGVALSTIAALDDKIAKISKNFVNYRNKVIDEYGEEVDAKFIDNDILTEAEVKSVDEEGNESTETKKAISFNITNSDFVRVFDAYNDKWQGNAVLDEATLSRIENWYTKQLQARRIDHTFMNTIDHELGFEKTGIGHFYGWTSKPGCCIDFGAIPCIKMFEDDNDEQFPMLVPVETAEDYDKFVQMMNEDTDHNVNAHAPGDVQSRVCYLLHYNVDCDDNGTPREIYNEVYGTKELNV